MVFDDQGNLETVTNREKNVTVTFSAQGFYYYTSKNPPTVKSNFYSSSVRFEVLLVIVVLLTFRHLVLIFFVHLHLLQHPLAVHVTCKLLFRSFSIRWFAHQSSTCTHTDQVQTASIVYNDWASQEFRVYSGAHLAEIDWIVGPIPVDDQNGKEIIMRYDTDIPSNGYFYTDANGREMVERRRDYRSSYNYTVYENVSGNYNPVTSRIWIKDTQRQLTVLTGLTRIELLLQRKTISALDRSEGGSSIHDGSIELMVHRRTLYDDSQGVHEPINETAYGTGLVIRGQHHLLLAPPESSALHHRPAAQHLFLAPVHTYAIPNTSYADYSTNYRQTWSALSGTFPSNVHLLTMDHRTAKVYLVRVEHYFELNEDATLSQPVQVDLQILFQNLGKIQDIVELILTGNLPLSELKRLEWTTDQNGLSTSKSSRRKLSWIEIQSFVFIL